MKINIIDTIKDFAKKALLPIVVAGTVLSASGAASTVTTAAGVTPTIIVSNSCRTVQFIINNTSLTANGTHTFFDAPPATTTTAPVAVGAAITNVIPSYTYISRAMTHITNAYTSYNGFVYNTNVQYDAFVQTTNTVAQTTNGWPILLSVIVPTNSTLTLDFNQRFINGILNTNSGGGSVTVTYTQ